MSYGMPALSARDEIGILNLIRGPIDDYLKCGNWVRVKDLRRFLEEKFPEQGVPYLAIWDVIDEFGAFRIETRVLDDQEEVRRTLVTCTEHPECLITTIQTAY